MSEVTYQTGQGTVKITLERKQDGAVTATIGDKTYELTATQEAAGEWTLEHNGRRIYAYTAHDGPRRFAQVMGGPAYALNVAETASRRRSGTGGGEGSLTAQMPGQVVEVLAEAGTAVMAGQPLIILEAMKMEIRVAAPRDGTVRDVFVKKGDVVERDQQLLALE